MPVVEEMTSLSKLIKSSRLGNVEGGSVSIKVAPIFSRKQSEATSDTGAGHNIDYINQTIEKAKEEAASIVELAAKEREKVTLQIEKDKKAWEEEKEKRKQQAYMEGYEQGYQVGEKEALTEYEARLAEAQRIIELAKLEHHKKLDSSIESIVTISMKVAEKVLGCTLETDPSIYTKLVQTALKEVKEKEEIRIYVSTKQYPNILQNKQLLQNIINSQYDLAIYPEPDLGEDGCWIDSSAGRLEVSIQTQLAEMKNHLLQLVRMDTE